MSSSGNLKQDLMASLMGDGGGSSTTGQTKGNGNGGGGGGGGGEPEADLFGDIPVNNDDLLPTPPTATATATTPTTTFETTERQRQEQDPTLIVPPVSSSSLSSQPFQKEDSDPLAKQPESVAAAAPAPAPSLLMQSGLLGAVAAAAAACSSNNANKNNNKVTATSWLANSHGGGGSDLFASIDQEEAEEAAKMEREEQERLQREQQEKQTHQQKQEQEKEEQEQKRMHKQQQQLQDQMQSIYLGNGPSPAPPTQTSMYGQQRQPYRGTYGGGGQQQQQQQHPQMYGYGQSLPQQRQQQGFAPAGMQQSQMINAGLPPAPQGPYPTRIPSQPGYLTSEQQPQQQQQLAASSNADMMDGFYRSHPAPQPFQNLYGPVSLSSSSSYMQQSQLQPVYSGSAMMPPQQQPLPQNRYYQPTKTPSTMAGMHNPIHSSLGQAPRIQIVKPTAVNTMYDKVLVTEPLLVAPSKGLLSSLTGQASPYWSYQITTQFKSPPPPSSSSENNYNKNGGHQQRHPHHPPPFWVVRRRFRHVVALEDRLHEEIPGSILPPRPDKHATRAIEEATTHQSNEFAVQRAAELQVYLNQLIQHPYAHSSLTLRLFLSLQDDLGTAWPEVSNNTLTRLANASVGAAVKVSETTQATKFPWQGDFMDDYGEDNAELLALANQEQVRMAAVLQAVPKLEGSITLMREGAERMGSTGMELARLAKEVMATDTMLGQPMDIISSGMLRAGRRNKRLALELFAALHSYSQHYKSCRYEKMAFYDRRLAMIRRTKEQQRGGRVDPRIYHQQQQQQSMYQQPYGAAPSGGYDSQQGQEQQPSGYSPSPYGSNQMMMAGAATGAWQECDEIGQRLRSEINRLAYQRRTDWFSAVKVVASSCKEAATENVAIWEAVRESFFRSFPQYDDHDEHVGGRPSSAPTAHPRQQS